MKKEVLFALVEKWMHDSKPPEAEDGSEHAAIGNAKSAGIREATAQCAHQLKALIALLATE